MSWIFALLGLLVGLLIGYLLCERRLRVQLTTAQEQLRARDVVEAQFRDAFSSLSADALAKNNEAFLSLAKERFAALSVQADGSLDERKAQIEGLLKPLAEILSQYQTRLGEMEQTRTTAYADLKQLLGAVSSTQQQLAVETTQLVSALRRPNTRGQWGEMTLRRLVELAGMSAHCDFVEQAATDSPDSRLRPDMVIKLPSDRQIVIDCKTVLDAFLDASSAKDEASRLAFFKRHAEQVRARAQELAKRAYWDQFESSPEFVVMFLPGEAFLYAAVEHDGGLIEDCMKSSVILATPTTLIALLKAIAYGWRQEQVVENAEEIRTLATELYDRLVVLTNHFEKLGASIETSVKCYNDLLGSLESRVLVTARKIGEMEARSDKELADLEPIDRQTRELSAATRSIPH